MHFRAIVTFNKDEAENSKEARSHAEYFLQDNGFCSQGFFSSGPADWFVIGGRWSGSLQRAYVDFDKFHKRAMKSLNKKKDLFLSYGDTDNKDNQKKFQKIWEELGGKGINLYGRDQYSDEGYDDDAMIVDEVLYKEELQKHEGSEGNGESFWDLDFEPVDRGFIGKKWIVVVDYHN